MSKNLLFIYPPTISYEDWITQRPQMLLKEMVNQGHDAILCNFQPDKFGTHYIAKSTYTGKQRHALWVLNQVHTALQVDPQLMNTVRTSIRVLWISHPPTLAFKTVFSPHIIVFDLIDAPTDEFSRWETGMKEAIEEAHLLIVTSDQLEELAKEKYPHKHIVKVNNAADFVHFDFHKKIHSTPQVMAKAKQHKHPVIGFHGSLQTWVDYPLIMESAILRPQYAFVMVGPKYTTHADILFQQPNILMVGPVKFPMLPPYVHSFDVGIIPFQVRSMTNGANTIKKYEYFAAGVPVVSTPIRECLHQAPYVLTAGTPDAFVEALDTQVLNYQDMNFREAMRVYAEQESWEQRVKQIVSTIESILEIRA